MNCLACSEENCTHQRCKDKLEQQDDQEIEQPSIEELIKELWP